jgi:hypothetical protein
VAEYDTRQHGVVMRESHPAEIRFKCRGDGISRQWSTRGQIADGRPAKHGLGHEKALLFRLSRETTLNT